MTNQEIESAETEISISIEQAKSLIEKGEKLERLNHDKDFRELFLEGYFRDESARLVGLLMDPETDDKNREDINRDLIGISAFRQYVINIRKIAKMMHAQVVRSEKAIESLRKAEVEED